MCWPQNYNTFLKGWADLIGRGWKNTTLYIYFIYLALFILKELIEANWVYCYDSHFALRTSKEKIKQIFQGHKHFSAKSDLEFKFCDMASIGRGFC